MTGCRDPRSARRDLGRRLAVARQAAGLTQRQLAEAVRYSRSTVSNAEIGHPDVARLFWTRCDRVLHSGQAFTPAFDQLKAAEQAAARWPGAAPGDRLQAFRQARQVLRSAGLAAALAGYRDLGWPAEAVGERADLLTGDVIDALEVPRHWGMLAASLWRLSQGRSDLVRRLPALPRPARALAVIAAGHRWYFLAAAGGCPWGGPEAAPDGALEAALEAAPGAALGHGLPAGQVIRWHSRGGRIPAPPSRLPRNQSATWAYLPAQLPRLAPAIGLVGLLGAAAAMAGHELAVLTLPGGTRVVPAPGRSPAADPPGETT
jgi:hypothetical protein